jgi:hypothetical protein
MSHSVELVGNWRKDALGQDLVKDAEKSASDMGEFEDGSDEAKELS